MDTRLSIQLVTPRDKNLSKRQRRLVRALSELVESEDLRVSEGLDTDGLVKRYERICRSQGSLIVALSQWEAHRLFRDKRRTLILPSEFLHLASAMAVAAKKPLLLLREKNVAERGSLKPGYVHPIVDMPIDAEPDWLKKPSFRGAFDEWLKRVREHRHVFLGYSSQARETARAVSSFLAAKLKLSVLDWHDFRPSGVIMQNIDDAERLAMWGIFLFMADDTVKSAALRYGAPRDNVIYEAGYFAGAKGQTNTLIIREGAAKLPTDLGGVIYLELQDRNDISPIETKLREYFESVLPS